MIGEVDGATLPIKSGGWTYDEDDLTLIALLGDPVYMSEMLWEDPSNREYGGCYKVRDYQYPLFRMDGTYEIAACARSVGKTESIKAKSQCHVFKRVGLNLLLTAPELIHLLPLTDAVENNLRSCRLTREFLDTRNQGTGFQHRPFQANFIDKTKIVGRIPKLTGTGVKGQHQPDLIMDEGQDYPEKGYVEVHETVMKDTVDADGNPDFHYHIYGVHSGDRAGAFHRLATQGEFLLRNVTAIMRQGWGKEEKAKAASIYGGTSSPDYRRNILGEPGASGSAIFVMSRLMACVDQGNGHDPNTSAYNQEYQAYGKPVLRAEEVDKIKLPIGEILDLPSGLREIYCGMDIGLAESPTVITIFSHQTVDRKPRLKLVRRLTLERFRTRDIRATMCAIAMHFGSHLKGFGVDSTGLGLPIIQELQDDPNTPRHLLDVHRGFFFNAKVPVAIQKEHVLEDNSGVLKDPYGSVVKIEEDPLTGVRRYVTYQPMIEASTRYLREFVDSGLLLLPFDPEVVTDMQGETQQRIQRVGAMKKKPNAFHILDSMRAMAMVFKQDPLVEFETENPRQEVLDTDIGGGYDDYDYYG